MAKLTNHEETYHLLREYCRGDVEKTAKARAEAEAFIAEFERQRRRTRIYTAIWAVVLYAALIAELVLIFRMLTDAPH